MGAIPSLMNKDFKIVEKKKLFTAISGVIVIIAIIVGIIFAAIPGGDGFFSLGLDFEGGYSISVTVNGLTKQNYKENLEKITEIVESAKDDDGDAFGVKVIRDEMQVLDGSSRILIRYKSVSTDLPITVDEYMTSIVNPAIKEALDNDFSGGAQVSWVKADALFAKDGTRASVANAMFIFSLVLTVFFIYIAIRNKALMGFTAALSMLHEFVLMLAFAIILRIEISSAFFIAFAVALIFTAINNILLFVKIREEQMGKGSSTDGIANKAVKAALPSIAGATVIPLAAAVVLAVVCSALGLGAMTSFTYPLIFGLLAGVYSSLCVSPSLWVIFKNRNIRVSIEAKRASKKK